MATESITQLSTQVKSAIFITALAMTTLFYSTCSSGAPSTPMTFELQGSGGNCGTCEWVQAEGIITATTPITWKEFIKQRPPSDAAIRLNSPGGDPVAAMELGRLFRAAHAFTQVGGVEKVNSFKETVAGSCASACTLAFLGGETRSLTIAGSDKINLSTDPKIHGSNLFGVHRFEPASGNPSVASAQMLSSVITGYLYEMGVDPKFLTLASSTPASEMRYITLKEAQDYSVVNDTPRSTAWAPERMGTGLQMVSRGTAINSESIALIYQYSGTVRCNSATSQDIYLTVQIKFHGESPVDERGEILRQFCSDREIKIADGTLGNCGPENVRNGDVRHGKVVRVFSNPEALYLYILLGNNVLSIFDTGADTKMDIVGYTHSTSRYLPDHIPLSGQGLKAVSSLLRRNCIGP